MTSVSGTFFDGVGSRGEEGSLTLHAGTARVESGSFTVDISMDDLIVEARLGNTPRRFTWGGHASFVHRMRQWFLAINMLLHPHRFDGGGGMVMVRRADGHDVDLVTKLVEHLAIIGKLLRVGKLAPLLRQRSSVNVAQPDDGYALFAHMTRVARALAADTDTCGTQ